MTLEHVDKIIQFIVFLFAASFHESAHAWMADRCGDPTAKMLGRVTMNPIKHIDPLGTILFPLLGMMYGIGMFGWAKPTPVTQANFRDPVMGEVLTTVAGPISNFILVSGCLTALTVIAISSPIGKVIILYTLVGTVPDSSSILVPVVWILYKAIEMNVLLGLFNLIPIPPLDGSHLLRHVLPLGLRNVYDSLGFAGFILAFTVGGYILRLIFIPVMGQVDHLILGLVR